MTDSALKPTIARSVPQPWLASAGWDTLFVISPAFLTSAVALALAPQLQNSRVLPLWAWVSLVLLIDVAHVYATLFRTYLDRNALERNKLLLTVIPAACWIVGALFYSIDALLFWRVLAYLAVFHFIRQQFGFMMLYCRREPGDFLRFRWLDSAMVYVSTLYPVLFWHTHLPRNFNWFVEGDFVESVPAFASQAGLVIYVVVAAFYLVKEALLLKTTGFLNVPRNLIVIGTALSWWVGIVALDSDMAFTMTNVMSHGIPYMALIWLYHRQNAAGKSEDQAQFKWRDLAVVFRSAALRYVPLFVGFLWILAYLEEGLWDGLVWREHLTFFAPFAALPAIGDPSFLALLVPFLALPQSTHYVLDGFIWRVKDRNSVWSA